ncbi:hypothetical protein Droror1_Dr00015121 [Drosera rotundifolia]
MEGCDSFFDQTKFEADHSFLHVWADLKQTNPASAPHLSSSELLLSPSPLDIAQPPLPFVPKSSQISKIFITAAFISQFVSYHIPQHHQQRLSNKHIPAQPLHSSIHVCGGYAMSAGGVATATRGGVRRRRDEEQRREEAICLGQIRRMQSLLVWSEQGEMRTRGRICLF